MRKHSALLLLLLLVVSPLASAQEPPDDPPPALQADLSVLKTGPSEAAPDTDVTYTVTVHNFGPDPAEAVTLTDNFDGMSFVSATEPDGFDCAEDPDFPILTCTGGDLAPGATITFTFVFHIPDDASPGDFFVNVASAATESNDPNEENNSSSVTTFVPSMLADAGVTKSGPSSAGPGSDVTWTIRVFNGGPSAATNVALNDTLPGTMTFVSLAQPPGFSCTTPAVGAGGTITCTAATMGAGTTAIFTLTANIPADTAAGTELSNTAILSAENDVNEENDVSTASLIVASVDVSVVKTTTTPVVTAGENASFTITVENEGPDPANDVTFTDAIPAGTTFVSLTRTSGENASHCSTGATVSCTFNVLLAGQSSTYTLVVRAGDVTSISNTANVTTSTFDDDASNDSSTAPTVTVVPSADLALTKSGPASATAGTNATYVITLRNNGASTAANVSLVDTLPANTTFVSLTQSGPAFTCTPAAASVTCTRATLAPLAVTTFSITVAVAPTATGPLTNSATVTTTTTDPVADNNTATATTNVTAAADLAVTKSGPATASAGTNATYVVTLTNNGPSTAATVSLADALPANTTFVSLTQSGPAFTCTPAAASVTCTRATLAPLEATTFNITVAIAPTATGPITNSATVTSTTTDPAQGNNTATATTNATASADLSVTKSGPVTGTAGTNVTYSVTVNNLGPSTAAGVSLVDTFPAGATYVSFAQTSGPAFTCVPSTTTLTCTRATLDPSAPATFDITFAVPVTAPAGTITNSASVSSATPDPVPTNNTASALTGIGIAPADVSIAKSANAPELLTGSSAIFTLLVRNAGPGVAEDVVVTDVLPAGTTLHTAPGCTGTTTVTCNAGTLAAGATATFTLTVTLPSNPGPVVNTATVTSSTPDPTPNNNAGAVTIQAVAPAPAIPTASEWGLLLLALGLCAAMLLRTR